MLDSIFTTMQIQYTMEVNRFLASLRRLPLIGKFIPSSNIKFLWLKILAMVWALIKRALLAFLIHGVISFVIYVIPYISMKESLKITTPAPCFFMMAIILYSLIGAINNTTTFAYNEENYISIILLRMESKPLLLGNMILKNVVNGLFILPIMLVMGIFVFDASPLVVLIYLPLYLACKIIGSWIAYLTVKHDLAENKTFIWTCNILSFAALALLLGLTYLGIGFSFPAYVIVAFMIIALSVLALCRLLAYDDYNLMYKKAFSVESAMEASEKAGLKKDALVTSNQKKITIDKGKTSNKTGFEFLHEMFCIRHRKLLYKPSFIKSLIITAIGLVVIIYDLTKNPFNSSNYHPVMIMRLIPIAIYYFNTGSSITSVMYANCDHAMLTYNFYRSKATILKLFRLRVRSPTMYNAFPTMLGGVIICILNVINGVNDDIMSLISILVSMFALNCLFSLHWIAMYYLFQPYTADLKGTSKLYGVISFLTYWVCYMLYSSDIIKPDSPLTVLCLIYIAITLVYYPVALLLVKRIAPKHFKNH